MINALSIDVEEYYQINALSGVLDMGMWDSAPSTVERNTSLVLDILDSEDVKATFFCLGWVARRNAGIVRRIHDRGHEVACHGYSHILVNRQSPGEFEQDVKTAKSLIEDTIGERVIGYRAPTYSITRKTSWAIPILEEAGFRYDSSIFPIYHDTYGIPEAPRFPHRIEGTSLVEFPMSTLRVCRMNLPVCGGGYFRLLPYTATRFALRSIERSGMPFIFYLHPWEIDPDTPRVAGMQPLARFRTYTGIPGARAKFALLLKDFAFAPVKDVLAGMGLL
ncbi:MAG TPA: DUF3473 domain-containing protein [Deltaproteobacteria bacterium]|mgnify:CR=1 FL=1|nr:DUF3473 domain-containing protein [Deltaproteobacteria bacterium]HPP81585.1 DUF3473 domain-containing protein [Deltaproteobacteria bacterium]